MSTDPNDPTKGAGTQFGRLKDTASFDPAAPAYVAADWDLYANIASLEPGGISVEADPDDYLDDEYKDWAESKPGEKTAGPTNIVITWKPGETKQQQLWTDVKNDKVTYYLALYPNGTFDVWHGYISELGRTIVKKERIRRSFTIQPSGVPVQAEDTVPPPAP